MSLPCRTLIRGLSSGIPHVKFPTSHAWNKSVSEGENLVGFPTSFMSMKTLMSDDVTSIASHFRRLMGSGHPVMTTLKRMVFDGRNVFQVRGLLALLLAQASNKNYPGVQEISDYDPSYGILERQRKMGEIIEMIYTAQMIHKSVVDLPVDLHKYKNDEYKEDLLQLEYGNKISILGGDYLLAQASLRVSEMNNTHIVEMISVAIAEFTQAEFLGKKDIQGRNLPDDASLQAWIHRNTLSWGKLMAYGCKSSIMLATNDDKKALELGYRLGNNIGLTLQAQNEVHPFIEDIKLDRVDLCSAPIIFHLQNNKDLMNQINNCKNIHDLDMSQIIDKVRGGEGVQMTCGLINKYVNNCLMDIEQLPDCEAKQILNKILVSLKY